MTSKKTIFILLFIIALAAILRMYRVDVRPLYGDELNSLKWSSNIKEYIKTGGLRGDEKPLYYIMLYFWSNFVNGSEVGMRSLSVFAGVFSVLVIFMLAKSLINEEVGLLSAFILAISPVHIYYSQEIRMYELQILFALLSFYLFSRFFVAKEKKIILRVGYILSIAISIHFHITSILALLVQNIYYFLRRKESCLSVKDWLIMQLFVIILTPQTIIPLLFIFGYRYGNWARYIPAVTQGLYISFPIMDIPKTYSIFSIGFLARKLEGNLHIVLPACLLFASLFLFGLKKLWSFWRKNSHLLTLLCFIPVFSLFFLFVFLKNPFEYRSRYVLISSIAYYIILSVGIESVKHRLIRIFLILAIVLFSFFSLRDYYNYQKLYTHKIRIPIFKAYSFLPERDLKFVRICLRKCFEKAKYLRTTEKLN